jgi:hypothetical protein
LMFSLCAEEMWAKSSSGLAAVPEAPHALSITHPSGGERGH